MKIMLIIVAFFITGHVYGLDAIKAKSPILIDGIAHEKDWANAPWYPLNQLMAGVMPSAKDFSGRFKVMWDDKQLYILAEITDDKLFDSHANPLQNYWDDDCLEVFIDEDKSGGNHQFNFNAFAYHVALDNQVVDIGPNKADGQTNFVLLNDHVTSQWKRQISAPHHIVWELSVRIFDDTFSLAPNTLNQPVTLVANKEMGFMLAYCDNDNSETRESFVGSTAITPINGSKNLGYIISDVFDTLTLKK